MRTAVIKEGYLVREDGTVWSCVKPGRYKEKFSDTWREMKPSPQKSGHMRVWLGRGDMRSVHRIVLEAFVGPCPPGMVCRHLDGNPANNHLDNLRWGTDQENGQDRVAHGTSGKDEAGSNAVLSEKDVREILRLREEGVAVMTIALRFGVHDRTIQAILYGRSWNHVTGLPPYKPKGHKSGRPRLNREPKPKRPRGRPRGQGRPPATSDNEIRTADSSQPPAPT